MSYGYDSSVFAKPAINIEDEAAILLDRIDGERQSTEEKARPLVFVAHSLGGIVVKQVCTPNLESDRLHLLMPIPKLGYDYSSRQTESLCTSTGIN
jgi:hypothetical protein